MVVYVHINVITLTNQSQVLRVSKTLFVFEVLVFSQQMHRNIKAPQKHVLRGDFVPQKRT